MSLSRCEERTSMTGAAHPSRSTQTPKSPTCMWSFSVSELAIPGAEIGRISATDADLGENAKLEYTILEGESGDTFNISGVNQEAVITLNKGVDYESRSSYSFSVEVLNPIVDPRFLRRGPFKDRASIRVAVLDADEPPRFSRSRYHMDVSENCPPACTVGRVSAVDPDTGLTNNIRFSVDPQSDPEALFRITPDTGLLTTAVELDREREHWHNITVIATQRDNPSQVSRVLVAIETLDLNDNAPELDRQYTTAMCDSSSVGQVVQVLRAIDRDEGGNDSTVYFSIPPESRAALNFSVRDSGGGGARAGEKDRDKQAEGEWDWEKEAVCLPQQSSLPSPGLSTAALLAILACVATLLAVSALSLSLRRQKRDALSPLEEDDVRENIITYDDEGGGEADTAAFDIAALQSAPHSSRSRGYRTLDSRNIRYSQHGQEKARTYSWAQNPAATRCPSSAGPRGGGAFDQGLAELAYRFPGGQPDHSLVIQNQGAMVRPTEAGAVYVAPADLSAGSRDGTAPQSAVSTSDGGTPRTSNSQERGGGHGQRQQLHRGQQRGQSQPQPGRGVGKDHGRTLKTDRYEKNIIEKKSEEVQSETLPREHSLVMTRSGSVMGQGPGAGGWVCDSATLPMAGRRASRGGLSPKRACPGQSEPDSGGGGGRGGEGTSGKAASSSDGQQQPYSGHNYSSVLHGEGSGARDYAGSLGRGGLEMGSNFVVARPDMESGLSLTGTPSGYPEAAGFMGDWRDRVGLGGYGLGRRDMSPQLLPFPGQPRGAYAGVVGVGEFLRLRLAQVTFDPSQPPYDSVQVYGLEGTGSRAGSLSSLESEGEREDWGAGLEEWGPQFQKLAQLFKDMGKEREDKEKVEEDAKTERETNEEPEKRETKEGGGKAGEEEKD
ncbi:unnamed protein product [Menidia menidia]|uniref:(Atlantic silverside) hypothetical protein n=1 Tax=Menidia menidia TaxID=238744 RepID=A0A8S4AWK0_9TELE|nr:unnamed protein product [Menidia menidia]